ncbi:MBOAT family O-acyltransferase [Costertonia aggregata]|uniref:MBOAT family protein n=1 Tax=Costertonia aggregata TaxID=343403 RepID=A0A7H9ATL4_9FLAO|nr:MBOAT family O-acyltransferase [Costertonia aggregata]QLG46682.1 MBOAT family protein [Costertonia aggregata]
MLFNSIDFIIFFPVVFVLYWYLAKTVRQRNAIILFSSYVFYGWWDWRFLFLIATSSLIDFLVGKAIGNSENLRVRKRLLYTSLAVNLGALLFFKYCNFFIDNFIEAFSFFGHKANFRQLNIILPVGISFYTFQTLSYTIDIYRKKIKATDDFLSFFAFVSFFPQLVAGPIERASNLLPQFYEEKRFAVKKFSTGLKFLILGFFLKLVIADRAAVYVNAVYNNVENHDGYTLIMATLLFSFQIYGDFAGYSLIAIGTAKFFDFDLMTNFRRPYFSASISEFWTRWHISLSTWFRDYLYIPLGGNRTTKSRWLFNIFITFLISGFWHGANWTFIIWGALNGGYIVLEKYIFKKRRTGILNIMLTFVLINISWVFFRANSVQDAYMILQKVVSTPGSLYIGMGDDIAALIYSLIAILMLMVMEVKKEFFNHLFSFSNNRYEFVRLSFFAFLIFMILYLGVFDESQFIYFQF